MLGQADFKDLVPVRNIVPPAYQGDFIGRQRNSRTVKGVSDNRGNVMGCMKTNLMPAAGKDENGIKNTKRTQGACTCDRNCIHWRACLEELRGGSERVLPCVSDTFLKINGLDKPFSIKSID